MKIEEVIKDLEKEGFKAAPSEHFSDKAFVKMPVAKDDINNCNISDAYFEEGCRSNWQKHPPNQIMYYLV